MLGGTSSSAAGELLGLWSIGADKRKLLFLRRLICASEHCIHRRVFMIRLISCKWNPEEITGFIPDLIGILRKYSLWEYMDNFLQSGDSPSESEWKKLVMESIKHVENESWKMKVQRYDQLRLYNQVVKEPTLNLWLHFSLENSEMADRVSKIVKILCGSFYVNGARFIGGNKCSFFVIPVGNTLLIP